MKGLSLFFLSAIFCAYSFGQSKSTSQQKSTAQQKSIAQQKAIEPAGLNLENITYPFPVNFISASAQWQPLKMAYMDVQPDIPNGKTILLLHGKNFNGAYWENTAKELKKKGYRVIIPDQLGFGKSTKPRHFQ